MSEVVAGRVVLFAFAALYIAFAATFPFQKIRRKVPWVRYCAMAVVAVFLGGIPILQLVSYRDLTNVEGRIEDPLVTATLILEALAGIAIVFWRARRNSNGETRAI